MKKLENLAKFKIIIAVILSLTSSILIGQTPELDMILSEKDEIGSLEEEACFGCGDCSVYCAIENEYSISSSSFLKLNDSISYLPENVDDYNLNTAWVEGASGYGIGEWFEVNFNKLDFSKSDIEFSGLYLFNGFRKNLNDWSKNSRIKKLKIIVNQEDLLILNLADSFKFQSVDFISPLKLNKLKSLKFEILDVYKGTKFSDVALSELRLTGVHHH